MQKETFVHWWTLFCQRWDRAAQPELTAYYRRKLQSLSDEEFTQAADRALSSLEFFPTPEQLLDFAGVGPASELDLEVAAHDAWGDVKRLLRDFSNPLSSLDAPARRAVEVMGGLRAIGGSVSGLDFRRREFIEHYQRFAQAIERDPMQALPPDERRALTRGADPERLRIEPADPDGDEDSDAEDVA